MSDQDKLIDLANRIADRWGGIECPRTDYADHLTFLGDEGYSRYQVWFPGSAARLREVPDGRPFLKVVDGQHVIVSCETDAPDAWWLVGLDGSYDTGWNQGVV